MHIKETRSYRSTTLRSFNNFLKRVSKFDRTANLTAVSGKVSNSKNNQSDLLYVTFCQLAIVKKGQKE